MSASSGYYCLDCGEGLHIDNVWDALNETTVCSECGCQQALQYDESYDSETGEENSYFWLERKTMA